MLTVGGLHHGLDVLLLQARNALSHLCGKSVLCEERKKQRRKKERKKEREKKERQSVNQKRKRQKRGKKDKEKKGAKERGMEVTFSAEDAVACAAAVAARGEFGAVNIPGTDLALVRRATCRGSSAADELASSLRLSLFLLLHFFFLLLLHTHMCCNNRCS